MKFSIIILVLTLAACKSNEFSQNTLPDYKDYSILEKDQKGIYGSLTTSPNNGFHITRTTSEIINSTKELVNCTVTILGAYTLTDNEICLTNQMISSIKLYNRWGQEVIPSNEDLEKIRSNYDIPETFKGIINNKSIVKS